MNGRIPAILMVFCLGACTSAQTDMASSSYEAQGVMTAPGAGSAASSSYGVFGELGSLSSEGMASSSYSAVFDLTHPEECLTTNCGDCDLNGRVDVLDALLGAQHAVGLTFLEYSAFDNCDVDAGGTVDVLDALRIAQFATGLPIAISCC